MKRIGCLIAWCLLASAAWAKEPVTFLVEAEAVVSPTAGDAAPWSVAPLDGASGERVLFAGSRVRDKSPRGSFVVPAAGRYRIWLRYHRGSPTSPAFIAIIRDEDAETVAFHFADWSSVMPTERPYEPVGSLMGDRTGFIWEAFDATFERPLQASLEFQPYVTGAARARQGVADRQIDCLLLTTDMALDPAKFNEEALTKLADAAPKELPHLDSPAGFVWGAGSPRHVDAYAGVGPSEHRFEAGLINNGPNFRDDIRMVRLGFNHDHSIPTEDSLAAGIVTHGHLESYRVNNRDLAKTYPSPEGRFINAQGTAGSTFSFHFQPAVEVGMSDFVTKLKDHLARPHADAYAAWRTSLEDGGFFDYSDVAIAAFRQWLKAKHGDIATLNRRWNTDYADFDAIEPAKTFESGPACWLEHRDFSGKAYTEAVARQMPLLREHDPRQRPAIGANSNLDLLAPYFSAYRPMDFDELLSIAYADQPNVSWDTYCADDQLACETDMMFSFSDGRKPIIQEWSNHVVDARIAARSYWTMVGKGVGGIFLFMFQEGRSHATYPKWALLSHDGTPKPKLAAYSDAVQEVHRLEPLLTHGAYTHAVKPVALYWSRIDLSMAKPHDSLYGTTLNSPLHVYRTLRSLGYPVRWVTPRQIRRGDLEQVAALVMVGTNYVPGDVAESIETWVRQGGVIVGDELPGSRDEYAQPQDTLAPIFGVRVAARGKPVADADIAVQESTQGYGEVTDAAVVRREPYTMVDEIAQQPGATHPVALAMGDYMVSGIGPQRMQCVAGSVVGLTHRGSTGFVVNEYGKGKAFYSALMLGTIHESGGTGYEWDTTHSGLAYHRLLDAFLSFAGVKKAAEVRGLTPAVAAKLRIESPVVTPRGEAVIGITSFNDAPVAPFDVRIAMPDSMPAHDVVLYAATGGGRGLYRLEGRIEEGSLHIRVPSFDTHASILVLHDHPPLVSLELQGVQRADADLAGLAIIDPGATFDVIVRTHNPSTRALPPGLVTLTLPDGWLQSAHERPTDTISPGGVVEQRFTVRAPAVAGETRLRPLLARFGSGDIASTPATEMVWWGR